MRGTRGSSPRYGGRREQIDDLARGGDVDSLEYEEDNELPDLIMNIDNDVLEDRDEDTESKDASVGYKRTQTIFMVLAVLGFVACIVLLCLVAYFATTYVNASGNLQVARDSLQNTTESYLKLQQQAKQREEAHCTQFRNSTEHWLHLFCEKMPFKDLRPWVAAELEKLLPVHQHQAHLGAEPGLVPKQARTPCHRQQFQGAEFPRGASEGCILLDWTDRLSDRRELGLGRWVEGHRRHDVLGNRTAGQRLQSDAQDDGELRPAEPAPLVRRGVLEHVSSHLREERHQAPLDLPADVEESLRELRNGGRGWWPSCAGCHCFCSGQKKNFLGLLSCLICSR
ncbi:uncharacterized protein [Heterodontus francisci]|uniref:uncharacterized protein isoform X1 n=1 Tax=Heterodontus francisci TaxID=7792 RepID=UPI00355AEFA0